MKMKRFHTASDVAILDGSVTDVYFKRTVEVLRSLDMHKQVRAEIQCGSFPADYDWAVLAGIEEAAYLLEQRPLTVTAMQEGQLFYPREPVMAIEGDYLDFCKLETALLGLLCQSSGIATKAARVKQAAAGKPVYSFGARRMHPAIAPMIDRSAYIGGFDGVSVVESARQLGIEPTGTMPHSLILMIGDQDEAFVQFDKVVDPSVKRVALIDTYGDEKFEAINACLALGDRLHAVRLDTPSSRRGNFRRILEEVRWELDLRGFNHVEITATGGLDEYSIPELNEFVDSYGVGTCVGNAPVIDFGMDIVEIEGEAVSKRGKLSGGKMVMLCGTCGRREVISKRIANSYCCSSTTAKQLLQPLITDGEVVADMPSVSEIREHVLEQLKGV